MTPTPTILLGDSYLPLVNRNQRHPFTLCEGRRGTGKTRAILSILLAEALECPGSRWLLVRSSRTRLTDTVLVTLEQQVFPAFNMSVPGGAGRENRHEYPLPNGSVFVAMGLDDPARTQSAEFAGLYLAEGVEMAKLDDVTSLAGCLRQARRPDWPAWFTHRAIVDCNPGPPKHPLNMAAEHFPDSLRRIETRADYDRLLKRNNAPAAAGKWKRIVTCHQDNPYYFDVDNWTFTEPGQAYLDTLSHLTGHLRRRWLDGLWVAAEGVVYPEFDEARHTITPFRIPEHWPIYMAYDPGYDHPTGILWVAVGDNGTFYVIDEIKQSGVAIPQHVANVMAREKAMGENWGRVVKVRTRYGDPRHAFSRTAQSPKTIAQQWGELGLPMSPWPIDDKPETMVENVRQRLIGGRLKIFAHCQELMGELQTWSYKRTASGELPPGDDQYEDRNNDLLDPLRALCSAGIGGGQQIQVRGAKPPGAPPEPANGRPPVNHLVRVIKR